jgi:hypothetical protein
MGTPKRWKRTVVAAAGSIALLAGGMSVVVSTAAAESTPAAAQAAGTIVMLPPTRIADSRSWMSFPTFHGTEQQDLQIVGRGGVPMTGVAGVILNVTAVDEQQAGYLTVWPFDQPRPASSNVNFQAGQNIANTVIVSLPQPDGTIRIFNGSFGDIDVLVDVEGYIVG